MQFLWAIVNLLTIKKIDIYKKRNPNRYSTTIIENIMYPIDNFKFLFKKLLSFFIKTSIIKRTIKIEKSIDNNKYFELTRCNRVLSIIL